jgi:hypothetical protein
MTPVFTVFPGRVRIEKRRRQLLSQPANLPVADPELRAPALLRSAPLLKRKGRTSVTIRRHGCCPENGKTAGLPEITGQPEKTRILLWKKKMNRTIAPGGHFNILDWSMGFSLFWKKLLVSEKVQALLEGTGRLVLAEGAGGAVRELAPVAKGLRWYLPWFWKLELWKNKNVFEHWRSWIHYAWNFG